MPAIAFVNTAWVPIDQAVVSVEDRGFQLGDGIYEVIRTHRGRLHAVDEHLQRLFRSLEAIQLQHTFTSEGLKAILNDGLQRAGFAESEVYLQVTRGVAKRQKPFPQGTAPTLVITIRELEPAPAGVRERGIALLSVPDIRWHHCDIKSICLLPNVLATQQARNAGCQEALFVARDGQVSECASSNIFIIQAGVVATAPKGPNILGGITREEVIAVAHRHQIPLQERPIRLQEVLDADEVFISGSLTEILSVVKVDQQTISTGRPGPLTLRLYDLLMGVGP